MDADSSRATARQHYTASNFPVHASGRSFTIQHIEHRCYAWQVQKDALQRDYSNIKYEQPYQTAMYNQSVLCEAKRWHVHSYEEAIIDLTPKDLTVMPPTFDMCQLGTKDKVISGWR